MSTHKFPSISNPATKLEEPAGCAANDGSPAGQSAGASRGEPGRSAVAPAGVEAVFAPDEGIEVAVVVEVDGVVVVVVLEAGRSAVVGGDVVVVEDGPVAAGFVVGEVVDDGVMVVVDDGMVVVDDGMVVVDDVGMAVDAAVVGGVDAASAAALAAAVVVGGETVPAAEAVADPPTTVNEVAHEASAAQLPLCGNAAVVSLVPAAAPAATVTANVVDASAFAVPGAPSAGTAHVSVFACTSSVNPCCARSAAEDETDASPRRPERSSITVAPLGRVA